MTIFRFRMVAGFGLLFVLVSQRLPGQQKISQADTLMLKQHVAALSADSMQGRRAGTPDERRAAGYIEAYFKKLNLQPAGDGGDFFQLVPLPRWRIYSSSNIIVQGDTLSYFTDFLLYQIPSGVQAFNEGFVLAGYGIDSIEQQVDSYHDLDVKNKIVVALSNRLWDRTRLPQGFQAGIETQERWARARGAAGLLLLGNSPPRHSEHRKLTLKAASEVFYPAEKTEFLCAEITDGNAFVQNIFEINNLSAIGPVDHASSNARLQNNIKCEQLISSNVIGKIEGSDRKEEHIVITAHYDHLGIGATIAGDSIYNGALDNASGVAVLLETARLFASLSQKPSRSILFMAVGAEELGLYGSKYFVAHPTVPFQAIVGNINIDVAGFDYGSDECWMTLLGAEYNDMGERFEEAAEELDINIMPNVIPSYYYRSDGYIFAQAGIPALSPASGMPLSVLNDQMNRFLGFYHQPSDELGKTPIHFSSLRLQTQAIANGVLEVANAGQRPEWTSDLDSEGWLTFREIVGQIRVFFAKVLFYEGDRVFR